MTKILPTDGRVVLFTPSRLTGDGRFAHIDDRKPLAAMCRKQRPSRSMAISAPGCPTRSGWPRSTRIRKPSDKSCRFTDDRADKKNRDKVATF
jgi:hypothetical protein